MLGSILAATLLAVPVPMSSAGAFPMAGLAAPEAPVIQVSGGCGPYGHRGPYGDCRAGGQLGYAPYRLCPPGWHLGVYGRACWRN